MSRTPSCRAIVTVDERIQSVRNCSIAKMYLTYRIFIIDRRIRRHIPLGERTQPERCTRQTDLKPALHASLHLAETVAGTAQRLPSRARMAHKLIVVLDDAKPPQFEPHLLEVRRSRQRHVVRVHFALMVRTLALVECPPIGIHCIVLVWRQRDVLFGIRMVHVVTVDRHCFTIHEQLVLAVRPRIGVRLQRFARAIRRRLACTLHRWPGAIWATVGRLALVVVVALDQPFAGARARALIMCIE